MRLIRPHLSFIPKLIVLLSFASGLSACKGDGSDPKGDGGEASSGDGDTPSGTLLVCDDDADCDDDIFCNGEESCRQGFCHVGSRIKCDDDIACTLDSCVEDSRSCESQAPDEDFDGFKDAGCVDEDGAPLGEDCDDNDSLRYPGNTEICDPEYRDEDCDPTTIGNRDADNDGYNDAQCCNEQDNGKLLCGQDCDDHKPNVNPESPEVCDFLDNNCDGKVDEGVSIKTYPDTDHDGHGDDSAKSVANCAGAVGYALINDDCDDTDPEVFKGQFEICDDKDNNCDPDRLVDEVKEQAPWFKDADGDTYGDTGSTPIFSCYRPVGRVLSQNDCNDANKTINPNAPEICDALDNDCNGWADAKAMGVNNFEDDDGDLVADADCGGEDCDDTDPRTAGGAEEVCDHIDNDCDGEVDEQTVQNIWYVDHDGDGWGVVIGSALASCNPLVGRASKFGDCDDTDNAVHPDVTEYCDDKDNDCDGLIDEGAGAYCHLDNALSTCAHGSCQVFSCVAGFSDIDGDSDNGCESPVNPADLLTGVSCASDVICSNGNICDGIETCVDSECRLGTPINCDLGGVVVQGDVTITSGTDLKALGGVETITGDVFITNTQLTSLVGLESLTTIGGSLTIVGNPKLKKLSGSALSNLEFVGGKLLVQGNDTITSVNLPSLLYAASIEISENNALTDISGYISLQEIGQSIHILDNPVLESISGFPGLTTVGGNYAVYWGDGDNVCDGNGGILIDNNYALTELTAFAALARTGGDLCVLDLNSSGPDDYYYYDYSGARGSNQFQAASISNNINFPNLHEVGGGLFVDRSTSVNEITLPQLRSATFVSFGSGSSDDKDSLITVSLPKLTSVEYFTLSSGCEFDLLDMHAIKKAGELYLNFNCATADASVPKITLDALTSADSLQISIGDYYSYLDGTTDQKIDLQLPKLSSLGTLYYNIYSDAVTEISLASLEEIEDNLNLYVESQSLKQISFPKLTSIGSSLYISGPNAAPTFERMDFSALDTVGYSVNINAQMPKVSSQSGLIMPKLALVGTSDINGDTKPDNAGPLQICTGAYDQGSQSYVNAACSIADAMPGRGYNGEAYTCGQCD